MKRLPFAALALVALVACGGDDDDDSGSGSEPDAEPGVVLVVDNEFQPKDTTIGAGDTVTWRFEGNSAHNISGEGFESELMKEGEYDYAFVEPGEFDYVCTVHPGMAGTVVVE